MDVFSPHIVKYQGKYHAWPGRWLRWDVDWYSWQHADSITNCRNYSLFYKRNPVIYISHSMSDAEKRERERLRVRRTSVDITLVLTQVTSKSLSAGSRLWNASSGSECSTTSTNTSSKNRHLLFTEWCAASRQVLVPVRVLITMMPFTRE